MISNITLCQAVLALAMRSVLVHCTVVSAYTVLVVVLLQCSAAPAAAVFDGRVRST